MWVKTDFETYGYSEGEKKGTKAQKCTTAQKNLSCSLLLFHAVWQAFFSFVHQLEIVTWKWKWNRSNTHQLAQYIDAFTTHMFLAMSSVLYVPIYLWKLLIYPQVGSNDPTLYLLVDEPIKGSSRTRGLPSSSLPLLSKHRIIPTK